MALCVTTLGAKGTGAVKPSSRLISLSPLQTELQVTDVTPPLLRLTRHRLVIECDLDRVVARETRNEGDPEPCASQRFHLSGHVGPGGRGDEDLEVALAGLSSVHCYESGLG